MRNYFKRALLIVLAVFIIPFVAAAQATSVAERGKILDKYGDVVWRTTNTDLPIGKGVGKVCCDQPVTQNGALTIRLHFKVQAAPLAPTWGIRVLDATGTLAWSYSSVEGGSIEFWSDEVRGDTAMVEIYSTQENNPLRISIDRIAVTAGPPAGPTSIKDDNGLTPITDPNVSDGIRNLGKAVARIRFVGDDGYQYVCTGFLISSELFITNHHCPQSDSEWRSTLVDFDFDSVAATPRTTRFKEFVLSNPELDFAIYRLATKQISRQPLTLAAAAPNNQDLVIIQHPKGRPKEVSMIKCRVRSASVPGVTPALTDFYHECDTEGGSSGSSTIDLATKRVIGLHHLGFRSDDPPEQQMNRAVLMNKIIDFIKANRPDIKAEAGIQ